MRRAGLLLLAALLGAGAARAEPEPSPPATPAPYALARTLQALQERVAQGDVAAHRAQRALIARVADGFAAADPSVWAEPRNARAAIAFALGGGPPPALARILASGVPFGADRRLAEGALAFLAGRAEEAQAALGAFDARAVGGVLGAQVALAQSALVVASDPAEAMRLLAVARLLAPGTLVEEAALRREIFVAGQTGDVERLERLAGQYLRRYRHSVYAGNFRQRFAVLLTTLDLDGDLARFARLETLLERFDGESRRDLYLFFARHSLIAGRADVARRAASRARELSAGGSDEEERATFYAAASLVPSARVALAADALVDLDADALPPADRLLLEAALDVAARIVEPVALDAPAPEGFVPPAPTPTMRAAEAALAETDALLAKAPR